MTKRRIALEPRKFWTDAEKAVLRARYPHEPTPVVAAAIGRSVATVHAQASALGIKKTDEYLAGPHACRLRRGDNVGKAFWFKPGQPSANKGLRRPGYSVGRGRMQETQFKKGERRGVAVALWKPIGTERLSKDGYLERKVSDFIPEHATPVEKNRLRQRLWRGVHVIVWEEANGPLPKGHVIAFKNGDKRDIRLDNLECITQRALMARNTIHTLPPALKETVQLLGRVNRQIRKRTNDVSQKQDRRSA